MDKAKRNKRFLIWGGILLCLCIAFIFCLDNHKFLPGVFDKAPESSENAHSDNSNTGNEKKTAITIQSFDSVANATKPTDTVRASAVYSNERAAAISVKDRQPHARKTTIVASGIQALPANVQGIKPIDESNNEVAPPAQKFTSIASIAPDKNIEAKIVEINNHKWLMIYPINGEWQETYIIYPWAAAGKKKLNYLVKRDFSGVTYPFYFRGELKVQDKPEDLKMIKIKGSQPDAGYPYYLNLADNPKFLIFGNYHSRGQWYIFENNTVKRFTAPDVQLDSLKSL